MTARVGIVGGYGAVGGAAARLLRERFDGVLRIGGRDPQRAEAAVDGMLGGRGEPLAVDVWDDAALDRFCAGCSLVVHAGGPSYQVVDRVARAAVRAGADYVDAGGDVPLWDRLAAADLASWGRRALVTAGMMPGLSGLLPRWLAARATHRVRRLTAYVGVMDRLTPAGAVDYLLSLGRRDGESQAVWLDGRRVTRAATPLVDVRLPFFPGAVSAYPYLGYEPERLARELGLAEVRWYSVFDGGANVMATLSRLQGAMSGQGDLAAAASRLAAAAELDLFGRDPYQLMVFTLDGGDERAGSTLVIGSRNTSELTGTVCALAALQVLGGGVPPGAHFAAEVLAGDALVAELRTTAAVRTFEVLAAVGGQAVPVEEGAL